MNYKRILRSRKLRIFLLSLLNWIPDTLMVRVQYRIKTGRRLNLKNPQRFTEKLQIYKLKYRNLDMLRCTDKYEVRRYVEETGYGQYLIPLIGLYNHTDDIDYTSLPHKFVAKTTDGGGGSQVLICNNKSLLPEAKFKKQLNEWMSAHKTKKHFAREWAYENEYQRRIIIEDLIGHEGEDLIDYKFFCFNGEVKYIYGISDRNLGRNVSLGIYDSDFNKLNIHRTDERIQDRPLPKPLNFETMKEIANGLSKAFPHVRVDLYNIDGHIYFGELTFYDGSGYMSFNPDSFDQQLGEYFNI